MASVSELVEDVAEIMNERPETVNAYARALIDSGDLPKSRGRAIAQVENEHVGKLILTVALAPKIKDASVVLSDYWNIPAAPYGPLANITSGMWITAMIGTICGKPESDEDRDARKQMLDQNIVVNESWTEIEIWRGSELTFRFQRNWSNFWQGYFKREIRLSCRAFLMLGFGKGRDYVTWEADD